MDIAKQLSVFVANTPGTLSEVCAELGKHKINIYALTISDTVDHAVVRMVVSDSKKALRLFEERGTLVVENDVLMIDGDNRPGSLANISQKLSKAKINIEYAYLATSPGSKRGLAILRPSNVKKALEVLSK